MTELSSLAEPTTRPGPPTKQAVQRVQALPHTPSPPWRPEHYVLWTDMATEERYVASFGKHVSELRDEMEHRRAMPEVAISKTDAMACFDTPLPESVGLWGEEPQQRGVYVGFKCYYARWVVHCFFANPKSTTPTWRIAAIDESSGMVVHPRFTYPTHWEGYVPPSRTSLDQLVSSDKRRITEQLDYLIDPSRNEVRCLLIRLHYYLGEVDQLDIRVRVEQAYSPISSGGSRPAHCLLLDQPVPNYIPHPDAPPGLIGVLPKDAPSYPLPGRYHATIRRKPGRTLEGNLYHVWYVKLRSFNQSVSTRRKQ